MANNYEDFGEKIGGAKKDLWATRGLMYEDLVDLNDAEIKEYVKKDNIWKKPNYQKMIEEGYPRDVVYVYKIIRDSLDTKPRNSSDYIVENYVNEIQSIKQLVEQIKTLEDFAKVSENGSKYDDVLMKIWNDNWTELEPKINVTSYKFERAFKKLLEKQWLFTNDEKALSNYYMLDVNKMDVVEDGGRIQIQYHESVHGTRFFYDSIENKSRYENMHGYMIIRKDRMVIQTNFETKEDAKKYILDLAKESQAKTTEKSTKTRKTKFKHSVLDHVEMIGVDYRNGKDVTGDDIMNVFGIRGGEFGNWLSDADSQQSLNHFYDSMMNVAYALEIDPKDISFNGKLAIAFGARGSGNALAHYEPLRRVINITKMRGAGSLGHEWIHALDNEGADHFGKFKNSSHKFLSEFSRYEGATKEMLDLMKTILKNELSQEETIIEAEKELDKRKSSFTKDLLYLCDENDFSKEEWETINSLVNDVLEEALADPEYTNLEWNEKKMKWMHDKRPSEKYGAFIDTIVHNQNIDSTKRMRYMHRFNDNIEYINQERRKIASAEKALYEYKNLINNRMPLVDTKFYSDAKKIDSMYSKASHGYWQSDCELLARAGASWMHDKLDALNIRDDYLVGHSETPPLPFENEFIYTSPQGEERKRINQYFDAYIDSLKEQGIFHHMERNKIIEIGTIKEIQYTNIEGDLNINSFGSIMHDFWNRAYMSDNGTWFFEKDDLQEYTKNDIQRFISDIDILAQKFGDEIYNIIEFPDNVEDWYQCDNDYIGTFYGNFMGIWDWTGYPNDKIIEMSEEYAIDL